MKAALRPRKLHYSHKNCINFVFFCYFCAAFTIFGPEIVIFGFKNISFGDKNLAPTYKIDKIALLAPKFPENELLTPA